MELTFGHGQRPDVGGKSTKAILVVGMHRSGTSALTWVLNLLGVDLPKNVVGPGVGNETGHWEPEPAVQLHRQMLTDAGSATNSPINFAPAWFLGPSAALFEERIATLVSEEYGSSRLFVMKEPRAALFVPIWIRALDRLGIEPHFIIPFRDPVEVARSLTARQQTIFPHSVWPSARGVALWLRYVLAAERSTRGHRRSFISFDSLLSDWRPEVARIARQLDIVWPREPAHVEADVDNFVNAQHRHQITESKDHLHGLPEVVTSVYTSLQHLVGEPHAQAAIFDRAATAIAAGENLLAPYVTRIEAKMEELTSSAISRKIVYISGEPTAPEHNYRIDYYAASAQRLGHRVVKMSAQDAVARLIEIDDADLVVIWRCAWSKTIELVTQRARGIGAKIIIDVDDQIFLEPNHVKLGPKDAIFAKTIDAGNVQDRLALLEKTIACADLCTATTQELIHQLRQFAKPLWRLPNGFDEQVYTGSQLAAEARRRGLRDSIRIGYAGGANELAAVVPALVCVLRKYHNAILVLLGETLALDRFPALTTFADRVEQRGGVPLGATPQEFARLDIAIIISGSGHRFTQVNNEINYIHAALVRVPIVASRSGFFLTEITPGVTGLLAESEDEWLDHIGTLVEDERLRGTIGENALHDALWRYGPESRDRHFSILLDYLFSTGRQAANAFRAHIEELRRPAFARPLTPDYDIVFESQRKGVSAVAVVIPLYNYTKYIEEALESVKIQTLGPIDLVVVDDCSTDNSLEVAKHWIENHQIRFNHVAILHNKTNSTLGPTRNAAFNFASARYIMVLDADNILLPSCLERCLATLESTGAAAAFPILKQFGSSENLIGDQAWHPARLACSNYIDAMAMIRKAAWAACGGYASLPRREDYELWMKFIENGFWAAHVPEVLALYRVHDASMVQTESMELMIKERLWQTLATSHPWIAVPTWSKTDER